MRQNIWETREFEEVARIATGQVSPLAEPYSGYYHIGPDNVDGDTGRIENLQIASTQGLTSGKYLFDDEAIVYSKIRPNLNKVCMPNFVGICSADMYPVWPREGVLREYLYQYMRSPQFLRQTVAVSMRTGMPKINREDLNRIEILVPPEDEQRRVADILATWDKAIDVIAQYIGAKQQRKRGLTQRLLTGRQRFRAFADMPWPTLKAGEIFQPYSKRNNSDEELLSVTQDQGVVPRSRLDGRVVMPAGETLSFKLVEPGDFIISLRSFQGGIEYSQYRGLVSPAYTVLKPRRTVVDSFYKHLFKSRDFIARLGVAIIGIRDGKQISFEDFAALRLAYPALDEQQRIAEVLDACDSEIMLLTQKLTLLKQQKQGLMQQLLTGRVRVAA